MIADKLIAHRGWQNRFPENTLPAIDAALKAGARHVEIDIQLTADSIPLLCHDDSLQRICGSDLNINHCSYEQLKNLSAHEPKRLGEAFLSTPLASLKDCVALIQKNNQATLYVELKQQSISEFGPDKILDTVLPLLDTIRQHCFLISFDNDVLRRAAQRGWQNTALVLSSFQQAFSNDIKQLSPPLIFCDKNLLSDKQTLSQLPYPTAIYEVDCYSQAKSLLTQGAVLIESFCIGELIAEDQKNTNG